MSKFYPSGELSESGKRVKKSVTARAGALALGLFAFGTSPAYAEESQPTPTFEAPTTTDAPVPTIDTLPLTTTVVSTPDTTLPITIELTTTTVPQPTTTERVTTTNRSGITIVRGPEPGEATSTTGVSTSFPEFTTITEGESTTSTTGQEQATSSSTSTRRGQPAPVTTTNELSAGTADSSGTTISYTELTESSVQNMSEPTPSSEVNHPEFIEQIRIRPLEAIHRDYSAPEKAMGGIALLAIVITGGVVASRNYGDWSRNKREGQKQQKAYRARSEGSGRL